MTTLDANELADLIRTVERFQAEHPYEDRPDEQRVRADTQEMARLGWPWIAVGDDLEAVSTSAEALASLFFTVGRHPSAVALVDLLVALPVVASALGPDRRSVIEAALEGSAVAATAIWADEEGGRVASSPWSGVEIRDGEAFGSKTLVHGVDLADQLIVFGTCDKEPCLSWVSTEDRRVRATRFGSPDRLARLGGVQFDGAPAESLLRGEAAVEAYSTLEAVARVAVVAELAGLSRAAVEQAVDYAKDRQQFGRAIGSFQAVKHLLAEAWSEVYALEASSRKVARSVASGAIGETARDREAKIHAALASRAALEAALQVYGGIGFTLECPLSWYFHRVATLWGDWGDPTVLMEAAGRSALETACVRPC